jgi:hypothetical protein
MGFTKININYHEAWNNYETLLKGIDSNKLRLRLIDDLFKIADTNIKGNFNEFAEVLNKQLHKYDSKLELFSDSNIDYY